MAYNPPPPYGNNPPMPPGGGFPPGPPGGAYPPAGGFPPGQPGGYQPYIPPSGPYVPAPMPPPGTEPAGAMCPPPIFPGQPMAPPPEENPPVPFKRPLLLPAQDGLMVVLRGDVPPGANRFHINLLCGAYDNAPIALHVNPRFEGTNQIVRNTYLGGSWGEEERQGAFPLAHGRDFDLMILFTKDSFKVAFNGAHYCDFRYRTRMQDVTHVEVAGDVKIRCLKFTPPSNPAPPHMPPPPYMPGPPMMPPMMPPVVCPPHPGVNPPPPVAPPVISYNVRVPHKEPIRGGFLEGRRIHISGRPTGKRFDINLCFHDSHKRDIAFHFNPRFDEKVPVVVRNTMAGYTWGKEERKQPSMPFKNNEHFDLVISCHKDKFVVHVNGKHFIEYSHRLRNLGFIKLLYIDNGVQLSGVLVE